MAYPTYSYPGYQPYYPQAVPDQLAQLRQNQQIPAQPQMMTVQTNMGPISSNAPQNNGIICTNGKTEADGYLVAPHSRPRRGAYEHDAGISTHGAICGGAHPQCWRSGY